MYQAVFRTASKLCATVSVPVPRGYILSDCSGCRTYSSDLPFSSQHLLLLLSTCQTLRATALWANTNAWLLLMDRDSCRGNTKCLRTHTHTHARLFIEGATRAGEQINDFTSQLAHSAREETVPTGLCFLFFSAYPDTSMSAWRLPLI